MADFKSSVPKTGRVLTDEQTVQIADELSEATASRSTIPLVSPRFPGMTVEDSYAIQGLWRQRREDAGGRVVGFKIGLTSHAMQEATGIDEPDYGVIFADQLVRSGESVEHARWSNVRVEVELAFILKDRLEGTNVTAEDVLAATEVVVPALEILDSHIELSGRTIVDTIADNAALGAVVIGDREAAPREHDLAWIGATCAVNGEIIETGVSAGVLGHPAESAAWLANRFGQHGQAIEAGSLLLAGSFTRPVWVSPGDTVHAEYQHFGAVEVTFE
ncbi:fumarylacetoacetate hydrolase family protein [uncultured Agrococcus sp.]|uniref:2-keto-4-pentenoate hydratase n=1 Tax=uncultured Agrococcus sp. TaxID=382258 RepID=UPI0025D8AF02|nr:fumarylacetoacetate hydrolase family protein [uncultured Agrococcus sp.]